MRDNMRRKMGRGALVWSGLILVANLHRVLEEATQLGRAKDYAYATWARDLGISLAELSYSLGLSVLVLLGVLLWRLIE